jgi:hypothetical protein
VYRLLDRLALLLARIPYGRTTGTLNGLKDDMVRSSF